MNLPQFKDPSGANGASQIPASIPSLKRTLSGGASSSNSNNNSGHSSTKPSGMSSISSVMHTGSGVNVAAAASNTGPPQMLRAVTSSGVFNRAGSSSSSSSTGGRTPQVHGNTTSFPTNASRSTSQSSMQDWRVYLTIEERQAVRSKIRDAYKNRCPTYEELLQAASAIEEELLHLSAPSRLDYFKSGFEFENRVKLKKEQLQGQLNALERRTSSTSEETSNNKKQRST